MTDIAGGECQSCGHVFAPLQGFGCERCGAHGDALRPKALAARGRVLSAATVFVHRHPTPPTPFTVLEVALADGPVIRALLSQAGEAKAGEPVTGLGEDEHGLMRFQLAGAAI